MIKNYKIIILAVSLVIIVGLIFYFSSQKPKRIVSQNAEIKIPINTMSKEDKLKKYQPAKEIVNPYGFINTDKISIGQLIGQKVVLVDFWTYSCINCQRTTPYLNSWYEKYKDMGFQIIGVHTPEFEFEKEYDNVLSATKKLGIKYPVLLDNDYSTWKAYGNRYWPRKYLIDIDGFIVFDHIGEGAYDQTEKKIQELLEERSILLNMQEKIPKEITQFEDNQTLSVEKPISPEIYFGAARNVYLGNGQKQKTGLQSLKDPQGIKTNILYLVGDWDFNNEFAENKSGAAKIVFRYQAKDVYIVASSASKVKVNVFLDGKPLDKESGQDIVQSSLFIKEDRLYKIIQDPNGWQERTLELIIETPGLHVFTFTFG